MFLHMEAKMADTNSHGFKVGFGGGSVSTNGMSATERLKTDNDVLAGRKAAGR